MNAKVPNFQRRGRRNYNKKSKSNTAIRTSFKAASLHKLPFDILVNIFEWLSIYDVLALRRTCKVLACVTRDRSIWHDAFVKQILSCNKFVPSVLFSGVDYQNETNLQRFSDRELEYLTLSSLRANKQWTAEKCVCVKKRHVGAAQNERGGYPFKFAPRFLTIKSSEDLFASKDDGRFLLSVFQHTNRYGYTNYRYSVKVLDLEARENGYRGSDPWFWMDWNMVLDSGNGLYYWAANRKGSRKISGEVFAVRSTNYETVSILLFEPPGADKQAKPLKRLKSFDFGCFVELLALNSNLLILSMASEIIVFDWVKNTRINKDSEEKVDNCVKLRSRNDIIVSVRVVHDWILVFYQEVLEMFFLPSAELAKLERKTVPPRYTFRWDSPIVDLRITERYSWGQKREEASCARCDGKGFVPNAGHLTRICKCRYTPLSVVVFYEAFNRGDGINTIGPEKIDHYTFLPDVFSDQQMTEVAPVDLPRSWLVKSHVLNAPEDLELEPITVGPYGTVLFRDFFKSNVGMSEYGYKNPMMRHYKEESVAISGIMLRGKDEHNHPHVHPSEPTHITMNRYKKRSSSGPSETVSLCMNERAGRIAIINDEGITIREYFNYRKLRN